MKRLFDILGAMLLLLALSPLLLVLCVLVRLGLGAPIFFRQTRIGLRGKTFQLIKFRTMTDARDPATGELLSDSRRTPALGRFLRATSLDELPEFFNVLKGDMSMVGPRPLDARIRDRFSETAFHRHDVLPGITGWAQIHGRNALTWDNRIRLDLWYIRHHSLWLDFRILLRTASVVLGTANIDAQARDASSQPAAIAGIPVPEHPHPDARGGHVADVPNKPMGFWRRLLVVSVHILGDAVMLFLAFFLSYEFRHSFSYLSSNAFINHFLGHAAITVLVPIACLFVCNGYATVWRYFGIRDIPRMLLAFVLSSILLSIIRAKLATSGPAYSVIVLSSIFGFWLLLALRLVRRMLHDRYMRRLSTRVTGRNMLVMGTSASAIQTAKALAYFGDHVVGFLTADPAQVGLQLADFPVLGDLTQWSSICYAEKVDDIVALCSDVSDPAIRKELEGIHKLLHANSPEVAAIREALARLPAPHNE